MESIDEKVRRSIQKLKVYEINKLRKMQRDQKAFFEEFTKRINEECVNKKLTDDYLSPKQISMEFQISRKTIDRWIVDGLKVLQHHPGSSIRVKRDDLETYLKDKYDVR